MRDRARRKQKILFERSCFLEIVIQASVVLRLSFRVLHACMSVCGLTVLGVDLYLSVIVDTRRRELVFVSVDLPSQ